MSTQLVQQRSGEVILQSELRLPAVVVDAGERAAERFLEFFTANIRNPNTRMAYARAVWTFMDWCSVRGLGLGSIRPVHVAAYIEHHPGSAQSVKQALAAIRMLFDWLVIGPVVPSNPATSVRGPKHVLKRGKTPVLSAAQARSLLDSIDTPHLGDHNEPFSLQPLAARSGCGDGAKDAKTPLTSIGQDHPARLHRLR